jgi:hypothetical protein
MDNTTVSSTALKKQTDRTEYMRVYMRKRYQENKEDARAYKKSVVCKSKNNIPPEELKKYGKYLADVCKLRKIKENLPPDIFEKVLSEMMIIIIPQENCIAAK